MLALVAIASRAWGQENRAPDIARLLPPVESGTPSGKEWQTRAEFATYQDSDAVTVFTPAVFAKVNDALSGWSASGSYLVDIVSAASVDIVSSASPHWREVRQAAELGVGFKPEEFGVTLTGSVSSEPDYLSAGGNAAATFGLARKLATLEVGGSYSHDIAGRKNTPFSVYSLELNRYGAFSSCEIVVDRATTFTPMLDFVLESGRQEKPYRYLPLFEADVAPRVPAGASPALVNVLRLPGRVAERVPDERRRLAMSGRLAHRFQRSTLVFLERLYTDDWGLWATTSDARFVVDVSRRLSVWPRARYHAQSGVSFWQHAYVGHVETTVVDVPSLRTGDRELGPIWSATLGPGARWEMGGRNPILAVLVELESTYTRYEDALYIDHRWSAFGTIQLEARFR